MSPGFEHTLQGAKSPGQSIVVVEDERIAAEDLRHRLEGWGYRVQAVVASGEEAVRAADAIHPDLMLMDIHLKGTMDGIEATRRIRARSNIPVIYTTSLTDSATLKRAQLTEPSGMIHKPYDDNEMRYVIATTLARRSMEHQVAEVEDRYRRLSAMSSDLILLVKEGRIIRANTATANTLGYSLNELLRWDLLHFCSRDSAIPLRLVLDEMEEGIPSGGIDVHLESRSGTPLTLTLTGERCMLNGESVLQIVMTDLTARTDAEVEASRFAEALFDAKGEADERRLEVIQITQELAQLRDIVSEQQNARRTMQEQWKQDITATLAHLQLVLSRFDESGRSPHDLQLLEELRASVETLQRMIPPDSPPASPDFPFGPGHVAGAHNPSKFVSVRIQA